jgi:hypothetical protein
MKPEYFHETCISLHVKDCTWIVDAIWILVDFIRKYETSEKNTLLCDLSELYVLVAKRTDDPKHDEYWKSVLNESQYEKYSEFGAFPLAFFKKSQNEYHDKDFVLIDFIDTLVRNNGFAELLMSRYQRSMCDENNEQTGGMLLPEEIIHSSVGYWRRILGDVCDKSDLKHLVETDVNGVLKWDELLNEAIEEC